ncbi:UDP-glycosyltransferase UGT5-like [Nymphalis io]|uniref:UDP-glycosyltransferase UGT5-like n=1 Tax=Inachis io TaxID=171585 RepID=UPI00216776AE|nr:UDP-glycosyltransferase UGT5-like [Nymphalis io]
MILTFKIIVALTISSLTEVQTLNILGVFPLPAKSHFFVFAPYLRELANRGHNVTVISFYPQKDPTANYHDINLSENSQALQVSHPVNKSLFVVFLSLTLLQALAGPFTCRMLFEDENVQNLWITQAKFDLVVVEQFNSDCGLALAHVLRAPVIGITSHTLMPWHYSRFGVPYNPSYVTFDFLEGGTHPTFFQRIFRTILYNHVNFVFHHVTHPLEQNIISEFFNDVPPLKDLAKNIKLVLVYQNFMLSGSTLMPSNIIEVGGYHVAKAKPLPDELRKFIEDSEHGVIYISFGTLLKASTLPSDTLQEIINALEELPQRVIWKWNKKTLPGNPKNIYVAKWLPQNDILAHPKVLAFYSHCGLLGTTEAIYHGVPIVGMPIYGDQPTNAAAIEESGLGVQLQYELLTKNYLLEKFKTVLEPKFREKVKLLSKAWHDRPVKAMDAAIFWTEFAARHQNFTFRSPAADVPLYQYFCLDIYAILLIFFIVTIAVVKYLITILVKNVFCSSKDLSGNGVRKVKVN